MLLKCHRFVCRNRTSCRINIKCSIVTAIYNTKSPYLFLNFRKSEHGRPGTRLIEVPPYAWTQNSEGTRSARTGQRDSITRSYLIRFTHRSNSERKSITYRADLTRWCTRVVIALVFVQFYGLRGSKLTFQNGLREKKYKMTDANPVLKINVFLINKMFFIESRLLAGYSD